MLIYVARRKQSRGGGGVTGLITNITDLGTTGGKVVSFTPWPTYTWKGARSTICWETRWKSELVWTFWRINIIILLPEIE